jgi:two-component system OmpR family sensor kinase
LSGSLEMLLIGADQGNIEASRRLLHGMYSEVQRMYRMIEDLLSLTRLDAGKIALRKDIIAVDTIISTIREQAQYLTRGQTFHCSVAPDVPAIRGDRDRLQQILSNIIDNAIKFTPTDGSVELRARADEGSVVITVSDTGQGIPPEALPHVFDRFYRADPSRQRPAQQVGGSGLGLSIAKELVEAQGGTITISSTLGVGTLVSIRFPAVEDPEQVKFPELDHEMRRIYMNTLRGESPYHS